MKADISQSETARILADIGDAVRPVERARTAAAVERVLRTAAPNVEQTTFGEDIAIDLAEEMGIELPVLFVCDFGWPAERGCCEHEIPKVDATPGMVIVPHGGGLRWDPFAGDHSALVQQKRIYAPWNVSPHLFPEVAR